MPNNDAGAVLATRADYPGNFFPDLLAFTHTVKDGTSVFSTPLVDALRYVTTNQSGTLNLTRHGTPRLNLNAVVPYTDPNVVTPTGVVQTQINQIVQTLKFHLPYFGQRFYRLSTDAGPATLNNSAQVPGSPKTDPSVTGNAVDHSEIYYYKVAANIRDYLDTDTQPTIINAGGMVAPAAKPTSALNGGGGGTNEIWAEGKETAPYLQEAAIRMRPTVHNDPDPVTGNRTFALQVDYYMEFWNMSDRDIYVHQQDADSSLPNLHDATIRVSNQNIWELAPAPYGAVPTDDANDPFRLSNGGPQNDYEIDLTHGVRLNGANGQSVPGGVVFKAGSVTVITTDPDCATWTFSTSSRSVSCQLLGCARLCHPFRKQPSQDLLLSKSLAWSTHLHRKNSKEFQRFSTPV